MAVPLQCCVFGLTSDAALAPSEQQTPSQYIGGYDIRMIPLMLNAEYINNLSVIDSLIELPII